MADLTDIQSAITSKIAGSDSSGIESNFVNATSGGGLHINLRDNSGTEISPATAANQATELTKLDTVNTHLATIESTEGTISTQIGASNAKLDNIVSNTNNLSLAQGSTTSGQLGNLILAAAATSTPTYIDGKSSPLSMTTSGGLRIESAALTSIDSKLPTLGGYISTGIITGGGQIVCTLDTKGRSTLGIVATGTWSGLIAVQGTINGTDYQLIPIYDYGSRSAQLFISTTDNATASVGGFKTIRLIASSWTSGTASCAINLNEGLDTVPITSSGPAQLYATVNIRDNSNNGITSTGNALDINLKTSSINVSVVGNIASAATDSGNPVKTGAKFNSTLPTVTDGQRIDSQADANGRHIVASVPLDGSKATYSASIVGLATAAAATDIFTITGSATKTIRVTNIILTGTKASGLTQDISLIKRSTANSAGTSTTPAVIPYDSTSAAGTAVVRAYTANPTLGTTVGTIYTYKTFINLSSAIGDKFAVSFGNRPSQAVVLRGTSQVLAINFNTTTVTTPSFDITIEWSEE